jgi:hypothetical protein
MQKQPALPAWPTGQSPLMARTGTQGERQQRY